MTDIKKIYYTVFLLIMVVLIAIGLVRIFTPKTFRAQSNYNNFTYPRDSQREQVSFQINQLVDFSGMEKEKILSMRKVAVQQTGLAPNYEPSSAVFGRIESGLEWWSVYEFFVSGHKRETIPGLSQESRGILNPLLLIMPEFWGLTTWVDSGFAWRKDLLSTTQTMRSIETFFPQFFSIDLIKASNRIEVSYDISGFLIEVSKVLERPADLSLLDFGVTGYNARDFNLRYVELDSEASKNIVAPYTQAGVLKIIDYLGRMEKMCYLDRPCNHRTQRLTALDGIKVSGLPAEAVFNLWRIEPKTSDSQETKAQNKQAPDVVFVIKLM